MFPVVPVGAWRHDGVRSEGSCGSVLIPVADLAPVVAGLVWYDGGCAGPVSPCYRQTVQ